MPCACACVRMLCIYVRTYERTCVCVCFEWRRDEDIIWMTCQACMHTYRTLQHVYRIYIHTTPHTRKHIQHICIFESRRWCALCADWGVRDDGTTASTASVAISVCMRVCVCVLNESVRGGGTMNSSVLHCKRISIIYTRIWKTA